MSYAKVVYEYNFLDFFTNADFNPWEGKVEYI